MSQKQAKRRRKEQRERNQQEAPQQDSNTPHYGENDVRDLEELLDDGNIDTYAQTCWSLANNT